MANYSLVINSRFRPFEYQELLAPVLAATQAHQTLEESYGQLQAQASTIEAMANKQNDPESYKAYKDYADSLKVQADDLAMNGLNLASRKALFDMRNRYTQEIMPIQEAYNRRLADIKAQSETMLKDPTHLFDRRARDISLDEYRNNPNLDVLSANYSKALLAQQVAQAATNLKGTILDAASKGKLTSLGLPYQYERQLQRGASVDEVLQAMSKDPKALPILTGIVESVMASSGIRDWSSMNGDWANNPVYKEAEQAAMQGLYNAIGNTEVKEFTDTFNMNNDLEIRKEERAAARAAAAAEDNEYYDVNPLNIYSERELDAEEEAYNQVTKDYSKYFYKKNGKWHMTHAGKQEYYNTGESIEGDVTLTPEGTTILTKAKTKKSIPSPFKKFVDRTLLENKLKKDGKNYTMDEVAEMWGKYKYESPKSKNAKYDATKVTEFDRSLSSSEKEEAKAKIQVAARGREGLKQVDYNPKTKRFEPTGDVLSLEDLNSKDYKVEATRISPYGNTVMITDKDGKPHRYELPSGISTRNESNQNAQLAWAKVLQEHPEGGKIRIPDDYAELMNIKKGTIVEATPEQVQEEYKKAIKNAYRFHSQLWVTNKTEEQKFKPYGY